MTSSWSTIRRIRSASARRSRSVLATKPGSSLPVRARTSSDDSMIVSGVRSSCETSSRNWRWLALAASTWLCALLERRQHLVDRPRDLADLVDRARCSASRWLWSWLAAIAAAAAPMPVERPDRPPDEQPAGQPGQQEREAGGRVEHAAQPAERLVDHRRRPADDDVAGQLTVEHDRLLVEDQRDLADRQLVLELARGRRLERQVPLRRGCSSWRPGCPAASTTWQ